MHVVFALPAPAKTGGGGGADYIDGLADGLRQIGIQVDTLIGDDPAFSPGAIPIVDGMLLPFLHHRLDELIRSDAVALIHHVAAATGRNDASKQNIRALERAMLLGLRRVVATSVPVAERLATEFGLNAHPFPPGIRQAAPATPDPTAPVILSVGVLTRRKNHDMVLRAAARLSDLPWRLVIAGDTQRDPAHADELRAIAAELGILDRLSILADPSPATLEAAWRSATVFALASRWEGFPTAVAEAIQRGIPVLATTGADAATIVPITAGAICPIEDAATFGKCLRRFLFDDQLRADMAAAALEAGQSLPRWPDRAREFVSWLERCS